MRGLDGFLHVSLLFSLLAGSGASLLCIFGGEHEKSREDQSWTSAVLYATFNSFIYVFVLEHFELALRHLCRMFVSL